MKVASDPGAEALRQLTLDLAPAPRFGAEDFLVADTNRVAFEAIELWPKWPDDVLLLLGPHGAGKSHLAAIWAAQAGAQTVAFGAGDQLDLLSIAGKPVLIEDASELAGVDAAIFHLLNVVRDSGGSLLITARTTPETWPLRTADVLSRLRLAPRVTIEAPDDALIRAVLVKLILDRQLIVDTSLLDFAMLRLERSLEAARTFVDLLDRQALSQGRRITRAVASDVLRQISARGSDEPA